MEIERRKDGSGRDLWILLLIRNRRFLLGTTYWSSQYASITYIELYSINVSDESHILVAKGSIDQVATAFT